MLKRALVAILLASSVLGSRAQAMDYGVLTQIGMGAGVAAGTLIGCRMFFNSLRSQRRAQFKPRTSQDYVIERIQALEQPGDTIELVVEKDSPTLTVLPKVKYPASGFAIDKKLILGLYVDQNYFVGFIDPNLSTKTAKQVVQSLTNMLVNEYGYAPTLKIEMSVSEASEFVFTVSGAKNIEEWMNTHLMLLKTWAVRYSGI